MMDLENPKLRSIVETARTLIWKHGFRRVTVEEICRRAGVSKMTFYKHFKNKEDLVKFVLDLIWDERMTTYREIRARDIPYGDKVKEMVRMKASQVENLSQELYLDIHKHASPGLRDHLDQMAAESVKELLADHLEAQKRGWIRADIKPQFILYFMNHMSVLLKDDALIALYETPQELIMELTNFFIYGLLPRDGEREPGC